MTTGSLTNSSTASRTALPSGRYRRGIRFQSGERGEGRGRGGEGEGEVRVRGVNTREKVNLAVAGEKSAL